MEMVKTLALNMLETLVSNLMFLCMGNHLVSFSGASHRSEGQEWVEAGGAVGHPVPGVSTEGGAGARSQFWVGSVILNKILGGVPKRAFSLIKISKM